MLIKPRYQSPVQLCIRQFSRSCLRLNSFEATETPEERPQIPQTLRTNASTRRQIIPNRLGKDMIQIPELDRLRIVPNLKTFYGGNPVHEENLNRLNGVLRKYINLPTRQLDSKEFQQIKFVSFDEYKKRTQSGTRLKAVHHKELLQLLQRLRTIDVELMPKEVTETLQDFMSKSSRENKVGEKIKTLDEFGRAKGVGKKKRSTAHVYLVKGDGEAIINGQNLLEYFPRDADRIKIAYPFQVISQEGKFNIFANVNGGGINSQAEAVMYGIAKALIIFNPLLKPRLYKAGLMTRDARKVERKKPGKVKARKSPTWVKR